VRTYWSAARQPAGLIVQGPDRFKSRSGEKAEIPGGPTRLFSGLNRGLCSELNNDKIDKEELLKDSSTDEFV
jgi:hypothetical protein